MDPRARAAVLVSGLAFCAVLGYLTIAVVARSGLDILSLTSFAIVALIAIGLLGALRHPPEE